MAQLTTRPLCKHCGREPANRPRGLGWRCYYTPGVAGQYPSASKYVHRGVGGGNHARPLPAEPTDALPGTPEKLAVLAARAEAETRLYHPRDAKRAE